MIKVQSATEARPGNPPRRRVAAANDTATKPVQRRIWIRTDLHGHTFTYPLIVSNVIAIRGYAQVTLEMREDECISPS